VNKYSPPTPWPHYPRLKPRRPWWYEAAHYLAVLALLLILLGWFWVLCKPSPPDDGRSPAADMALQEVPK
jgi:hypothetical protein